MPATYEKIQSTTLGSAAANITFSSISSAYTDLVLICSARSSRTSASTAPVLVNFNNDTSSNYSWTFLYAGTSTVGSSRGANDVAIYAADISAVGGSGFTGFGNLIFNINNYSNTTINKTTMSQVSSVGAFNESVVGLWRNTNAITTIVVSENTGNNFVIGSTFTLYGIKAA